MNSIILQQRPLQQPLAQYADFNSVTLARVLSARDTPAEQCRLQLKYLLQPHLLGLDKAIDYIDQAIDHKKKILIVGDYDVDGATSTTLMLLVLRQMGATVDYIVPDRFKYGYGLTPAIADLAYQTQQPDVLITVDNGISSHDGVARCHQLGMQVIITDHHLTSKATPDAEAVVNPNQHGCTFASKALAGVGVAFYVLAGLATRRQNAGKSTCKLAPYLDLVALGTFADVAKLDFNNRILVQAGLQKIRQGQCRPGILALLHIASKNPATIEARDLGFVLGPRINAAGRMDSMRIGIECLLADDFDQAQTLATELDRLNLERRQVEQNMREQAFEYIQQIHINQERLPEAIVLYEPHWHQGVIGIVAGRLKEHFHRPSIVFAPAEDPQFLKGSARSIDGIHIRDSIEAVAQQHPQLIKYFGGHAMAAGLTIEQQHFAEFQQHFIALMAQQHPDIFTNKIWTDGELQPHEFNLDFLQQLQQLGPWGQGFEFPIFEGIFTVIEYQWLKDIHLKLKLQLANGQIQEAVAFHWREKIPDGKISHHVRLAYHLEKNEFRGAYRLQLILHYVENLP